MIVAISRSMDPVRASSRAVPVTAVGAEWSKTTPGSLSGTARVA